jgi:putative chitinase
MTPLQDLQQKCGLTPDGVFGPKTFDLGYKKLGISTSTRAAHFFAQVNHETGGFKKFSENLNYTSAEQLVRVFRHDYDKNHDKVISQEELDFAKSFIGSPIRIANFVYANQNGNGPESTGDGWRYRGRGALQLTGRANYVFFLIFFGGISILQRRNKPLLIFLKR